MRLRRLIGSVRRRSVLQEMLQAAPYTAMKRIDCAHTLAYNLLSPTIRTITTSSGNVFNLMTILKAKDTSTDDRVAAMNTLNLSSSFDVKCKENHALEIVDSDVLKVLLGFLQDSDTTASSELLVPAFLALIRLSTESLLAQELIQLDTPKILAPFLTQTDPRLQAAACLILGNLALEPTAANAISSPKIVRAVFYVLESSHEVIKRVASTSIANIASSAQGRYKVIEQNGVQHLCKLLEDDFSDSLRGTAAFTLGNIISGWDIDIQDLVRKNGALPAFVLLLSPVYAEDVNSNAAWAVHHSVHLNAANQLLVAEAGGLGMLVQHIESAVSESLQTNALLALESVVVNNDENVAWCRTNGVVLVLQRIQESDDIVLNTSAKQAVRSLLNQLM